MPKEVVYGADPYPGSEGSAAVEVRWNRETGYFQIATRCLAGDGEPFYPDEMFNALKRAGIANSRWRPEDDDNAPFVLLYSDGMFVDLDRRGINDLIRNLRRARDQAYGKDE